MTSLTTDTARAAAGRMPLLSRVAGGRDEGAALMFVILAMLIAASLSLLVLGTVLSQTRGTQFDRKNARAIHAAEAGTEVALGQIRAARMTTADGKWWGDPAKLPCTVSGPVLDEGGMTYAVEVQYFLTDPNLQSPTWRATHKLSCATGAGTGANQPRYALILADGRGQGVPGLAASAGDRRLQSTYHFQITNENISGGLIENYADGNKKTRVCWDAGSTTPAVNANVRLEACNPSKESQSWAWRTDYTIVLVSTIPTGTPMCATVTGNHGSSRTVTMTRCQNPAQNAQKFGYDDNGHLTVRPGGSGSTRFCPTQTTNNQTGVALTATSGACGQGQTSQYSWQPEAKVGAGSVGNSGDNVSDVADKDLQWVNYGEFGRCFDVTDQNLSREFMIAYPCKQDPYGAVSWNQRLLWDSKTQQLKSNGRCLTTTKDSITTPHGSDRYLQMKSCSNTNANQKWAMNRLVAGDYAPSYTVVDTHGRCMGLRNGPTGGTGALQWSGVIAEDCDGSGAQKWNAPPDPVKSTVRDQIEIN